MIGERGFLVGTGGAEGAGTVATPAVQVGGPAGIADWRGDVALELWVETAVVPPRVRLAGRLDATTASNLAQVVRELLAEGSLEVELCTDGLRVVDASAIGALADIERLVRAEGGTLVRTGPPAPPLGRSRRGVPPGGRA
jgi:ABC-type transporter Mla MlaB component